MNVRVFVPLFAFAGLLVVCEALVRVPLGKVKRESYVKILPEVLEGLKQRYGGAVSSKVGDGPEPLHNYLDVSSASWLPCRLVRA
jgi:hypothetical protein